MPSWGTGERDVASPQRVPFNQGAWQEQRNLRQSKFKEKRKKKKTTLHNVAVVSSGEESSRGLHLNPEELARRLENVRQG